MKLSENFYLQEFKAPIKYFDNYKKLCEEVLEPVRAHFKQPIVIHSGWRSAARNKKVGGVPTSQHVTGEACDFVVLNTDKMKVYDFICKTLKFKGQVFVYMKKGHVHAGLPRADLAGTHKILEAIA